MSSRHIAQDRNYLFDGTIHGALVAFVLSIERWLFTRNVILKCYLEIIWREVHSYASCLCSSFEGATIFCKSSCRILSWGCCGIGPTIEKADGGMEFSSNSWGGRVIILRSTKLTARLVVGRPMLIKLVCNLCGSCSFVQKELQHEKAGPLARGATFWVFHLALCTSVYTRWQHPREWGKWGAP